MGFRSTFTIEDTAIDWPQWFRDNWSDRIMFHPENKHGLIYPLFEFKVYSDAFVKDIQKVLIEQKGDYKLEDLVVVFLHECGGISRCHIFWDKIIWTEPKEWQTVEFIQHNYCYGCSDPDVKLNANEIN